MDDLAALRSLATDLGVHLSYIDGLGNHVEVAEDTLLRICAALGAPVHAVRDCPAALAAHRSRVDGPIPPVLVAWDGALRLALPRQDECHAELALEDGQVLALSPDHGTIAIPLPLGYHQLTVMAAGVTATSTIIAAPMQAYRHAGGHRHWGVGAQLAALRSSRSRALADLRDLEMLCWWLCQHGANVVSLLPLLPTFNTTPPEPSPYSPVSRLFWSELILDLLQAHNPVGAVESLDVTRGHEEVRRALAGQQPAEEAWQDQELVRYARFRGAQVLLGRNWRDWPVAARDGVLDDSHVDRNEMCFHLVAQSTARQQLHTLSERLDGQGFRLGLDLTVGVHSDGYDAWSRQHLFARGVSVGAPPDPGFPSGQDWGFSPLLPRASREEGHQYLAASLRHQMRVAGILRVDHIMALSRLYWIPHGFGLHQGTYVSYPAEELFAVLTLESCRNRCEVVGENLGTVPEEINTALARHRIWGMYLAQFQAAGDTGALLPDAEEVALIGSHDTPTLAGWLIGDDIADRVSHGLIDPSTEAAVQSARAETALRLATRLGVSTVEPARLLLALLGWLGQSPSGLVVPWLEDLWLESRGVNLPGTPASARANWQRPMARLLDEVVTDPFVAQCVGILQASRRSVAG